MNSLGIYLHNLSKSQKVDSNIGQLFWEISKNIYDLKFYDLFKNVLSKLPICNLMYGKKVYQIEHIFLTIFPKKLKEASWSGIFFF